MPSGSTVVITYDNMDITSYCVFAECSFEAQMAAIPGTFRVTLKDPLQELSFISGNIITLDVDGIRLFAGFAMQISKTYFFPADNTFSPSTVRSRKWILEGVDFNILFDKLRLRDEDDYTHQIDDVTASPTDGEIIRGYFETYFDVPAGFDVTNATYIIDNHTFSGSNGHYIWPTQGATMREVMDGFGQYGSVYWFDADRQLNFLPVQDTAASWGFSDNPNDNPIGVGTPTRGFRDGSFTEDASGIINDALVWGGSEWAVDGDVVFARREDTTSINAHNRWQLGEVRVGEAGYKIQAGVDARAKVIVNGNESGTNNEGSQGRLNPERTFRCTWFSHDVPLDSGDPAHLRPGQVVPILLWVFSADAGATPFEVTLPLRQVTITFPGLDPNGDAYVQFDGFFGVLMSDPKWLWVWLRQGATQVSTIPITSSANNDSIDPPYGAEYQGEPSPAPDGVETVFTIPFPYISGTTRVYVNGLIQEPTASYSESDPETGEITFTWAPDSDDELVVEATLSG